MILNGQIVTAVSIGGQVVAKRGLKGDKGDTGDTGATGNGISSAILNQDYTLTLTFTNGTTYTTPSIRGQQGETGQTGATGDSGVYVGTTEPTDPSVMVWVDESDPAIVVNATVDGSTGTPSCDVTYDNEGLYFAFHNLKGGKGDTGNTGATGNGIASISKTGTSGKVDTYTITFTNGTTTTFTVTNGNDGSSAWADITGKPETFPPSSHNHNDLYYGKSDVYTKAQTDSAISSHHDSSKADATHNHDTRYYTESETDALLDTKADTEDIPTKTSELTNDSGFITEHQSLSAYRTSADQDVIDSGKVDKVEGKGLSTEDYTSAEKTKLSGIEANADVTDNLNVKDALTDSLASAWADADKKACCGTIGAVYDGQYELIEEITLTEATHMIFRENETDNTAYNFKKTIVLVEFSNVSNSLYASFQVCGGESDGYYSDYTIATGGGDIARVDSTTRIRLEAEVLKGVGVVGESSVTYGSINNATSVFKTAKIINRQSVTSLSVAAYTGTEPFPAGSTIKIYAIRN